MTTAAARLTIDVAADMTPDAPLTGPIRGNLNNGSKGQVWTNGTGAGQISQVYRATHTIGAGATVNFDTLAAGALLDIAGDTVNLDELKYIAVKVTSGAVEVLAPGANFLGLFKAAANAVPLVAGDTWAINKGAAGLDVTTNSKFDITDTAGGAGSVVEVSFGGAA
tara:strand:- start:550 stop:1047 length:498 start_codon:yes stop_codon:yes gene_type:complete